MILGTDTLSDLQGLRKVNNNTRVEMFWEHSIHENDKGGVSTPCVHFCTNSFNEFKWVDYLPSMSYTSVRLTSRVRIFGDRTRRRTWLPVVMTVKKERLRLEKTSVTPRGRVEKVDVNYWQQLSEFEQVQEYEIGPLLKREVSWKSQRVATVKNGPSTNVWNLEGGKGCRIYTRFKYRFNKDVKGASGGIRERKSFFKRYL